MGAAVEATAAALTSYVDTQLTAVDVSYGGDGHLPIPNLTATLDHEQIILIVYGVALAHVARYSLLIT